MTKYFLLFFLCLLLPLTHSHLHRPDFILIGWKWRLGKVEQLQQGHSARIWLRFSSVLLGPTGCTQDRPRGPAGWSWVGGPLILSWASLSVARHHPASLRASEQSVQLLLLSHVARPSSCLALYKWARDFPAFRLLKSTNFSPTLEQVCS